MSLAFNVAFNLEFDLDFLTKYGYPVYHDR